MSRCGECELWQRIETAPRDGTYVLVCTVYDNPEDADYEVAQWVERHGLTARWWNNEFDLKPTHWMPLPGPPKMEEANVATD
jgi:hypothetical protein